MIEDINKELQRKIIRSLTINSKIFGIFLVLATFWLLAIGLTRMFGVKEVNESLMVQQSSIGGIGLIIQAIIVGLLGFYNLKFSKKLSLIKDKDDFNSFIDAIIPLEVIYKIHVIIIYILVFMVVTAFLFWGLGSFLRK